MVTIHHKKHGLETNIVTTSCSVDNPDRPETASPQPMLFAAAFRPTEDMEVTERTTRTVETVEHVTEQVEVLDQPDVVITESISEELFVEGRSPSSEEDIEFVMAEEELPEDQPVKQKGSLQFKIPQQGPKPTVTMKIGIPGKDQPQPLGSLPLLLF